MKGFGWNHKRVYRIYCELSLNLRIKPRRRLNRNKPEPLIEPIKPHQVWSIDFMHDLLSDGRKFRLFRQLVLQLGEYFPNITSIELKRRAFHTPLDYYN